MVERLAERGRDELQRADGPEAASYDLRYAGQAFELTIDGRPEPDPDDLREAFDRAHDERYGYADDDATLELVTVRVAVALPGADLPAASAATTRGDSRARTSTATSTRRPSTAARRPRSRPGDRRAARGHAGRPARLERRRADDGTLVIETY